MFNKKELASMRKKQLDEIINDLRADNDKLAIEKEHLQEQVQVLQSGLKLYKNHLVEVIKSNRGNEQNEGVLFIDEEVKGYKISDLNTEQLIKQVVKNISDDVISVKIKKRHKRDEVARKVLNPK